MHVDDTTITRRPICSWDEKRQVKGATQWRYLDGQAIAMKGKEKVRVP